MFTVWCWSLQGIYFAAAVYLGLAHILHWSVHPVVLTATPILYEISFATAYLVTFLVTYVLIPGTIRRGVNPTTFFKFFPLLMHNANALFMMTELLLNDIPFRFSHFPYIVFFGQAYVIFSWHVYRRIGVFYYFFLDYELKFAVIWQLGLLFVVKSLLYVTLLVGMLIM
jgi:hypothetical protein